MSNGDESKRAGGSINIPGFELRLPENYCAAIALVGAIFIICTCVYMVTREVMHARPGAVTELRDAIVGGVRQWHYTDKGVIDAGVNRQFQFMTPSQDTARLKQDSYSKSGISVKQNDVFATRKVTNEDVEKFGAELIRRGFTRGWRRYPYEGQGRFRDSGWWWVISVNSDFDVQKFVDFYRSSWGTTEVYIEEIGTHGAVLPANAIPEPNLPVILEGPQTGSRTRNEGDD